MIRSFISTIFCFVDKTYLRISAHEAHLEQEVMIVFFYFCDILCKSFWFFFYKKPLPDYKLVFGAISRYDKARIYSILLFSVHIFHIYPFSYCFRSTNKFDKIKSKDIINFNFLNLPRNFSME